MQQGKPPASKALGRFPVEFCSKQVQWGLQSQLQTIRKTWSELPMKTVERQQQGRAVEFIVKLKKNTFFTILLLDK